MTAEVKFKDGKWGSDPIIITPEQAVLEANEHYTLVEYTIKVSVLRCYYTNEEDLRD